MKNINFSYSKLKGQIPENVYNSIQILISQFEINNKLRMAHFLSQCAHQSHNFQLTTQLINYKSAQRLCKIFPKYFKSKQKAQQYVGKPQKIANFVYADRLGNRNTESGDGYRFIGRGYIQLTGRTNYQKFAQFIKNPEILNNPNLVATQYPLQSAAFYWSKLSKCNITADSGSDDSTIIAVTKQVNGGQHGLQDRKNKFKIFHQLLQ